jgi:2-isopropylmalate synthase
MDRSTLLYDWNTAGGTEPLGVPIRDVTVQDETLRDGGQGASVIDPPVADKRTLLHLIAALGVQSVNLGFPAAGAKAASDVRALAHEIAAARLPLAATCAARTVTDDVRPIVEATQATGVPIEIGLFIGSSPIRGVVEGWTLDDMRRRVEAAVSCAVDAGHRVMLVTEDTTRAVPATLTALHETAIAAGADRVCLCDTVGHAIPAGVSRLVRFVRAQVGPDVRLDWHGHRDRGLGLANCLAAIEAGVDRVHATALGMGERVGNVAMETLLLNLKLLWGRVGQFQLTGLPAYAAHVARIYGVDIPAGQPLVGADAFATGTGVHASAITKARSTGDGWLADHVYSGFSPAIVGRALSVRVAPFSGHANVRWWLSDHGYDSADDELVETILAHAKRADRALSDEEISSIVHRAGRIGAPSALPQTPGG